MKKKALFVLLIPLFISLFFLSSYGEENGDLMAQAEEQVGYAAFYDAIPRETVEFWEEYGIDLSEETPMPTWSNVVKMVFSLLVSVLTEHLPILTSGLCLLVLFRLLSGVCKSNEGLVESVGYLSVVVNGVYSFAVMETLLSSLTEVSRQSSSFLTAALPVICTSQVWSGSTTGSVVISGTLPVVFTVISSAVSTLYYPLCWFCYSASLSGFYRRSLSLRPMVSTVKKFCTRGVEILSGLSVGVFCVQRAALDSSNTVARKGVHFALVQLLPYAGSALTDGIETVYACGKSMSGKIGVVCVFVVVSLFATPCILGLIFVFLYSLLSSVGSVLGGSLMADFFADVKDTFAMMTSFSVCSLVVVSSGLLLLTGG